MVGPRIDDRNAPVGVADARGHQVLVTIGEADLRMVALVDITVVAGRAAHVRRAAARRDSRWPRSPAARSTPPRRVQERSSLTVRDPSRRRHQFLISLEQTHSGGLIQGGDVVPHGRRRPARGGETAIEGIGTMEVTHPGTSSCGAWTCARRTRRCARSRASLCSPRSATSGGPAKRVG